MDSLLVRISDEFGVTQLRQSDFIGIDLRGGLDDDMLESQELKCERSRLHWMRWRRLRPAALISADKSRFGVSE